MRPLLLFTVTLNNYTWLLDVFFHGFLIGLHNIADYVITAFIYFFFTKTPLCVGVRPLTTGPELNDDNDNNYTYWFSCLSLTTTTTVSRVRYHLATSQLNPSSSFHYRLRELHSIVRKSCLSAHKTRRAVLHNIKNRSVFAPISAVRFYTYYYTNTYLLIYRRRCDSADDTRR